MTLDVYLVIFGAVQVLNLAGLVIGAIVWAVAAERRHKRELKDQADEMAEAYKVQLREIDNAYAQDRISMQDEIRDLKSWLNIVTNILNARGIPVPAVPQPPASVINAQELNIGGDFVGGTKGPR